MKKELYDLTIVGGGPVGLVTAIEFTLRGKSVLVLERNETYVRDQDLNYDVSRFKNASKDPRWQAVYNSIPPKVPIKELEKKLNIFANELKIPIRRYTVTNCKEVAEKYDSKLFTGADGARSLVRNQVFGDRKSVDKNLKYILFVKYNVKNPTRILNWKEHLPSSTYAHHYINESAKVKDGKNTITLSIFLSPEEYEALKTATAKTPYKFSDYTKLDVPTRIKQSIQTWLHLRSIHLKDEVIENSEKIWATHLDLFVCEQLFELKYETAWTLVGDAAHAVPYYVNLGIGIECAINLAENGCAYLDSNNPYFLQQYENFVKSLVSVEMKKAEVKDFGVNTLVKSSAISQSIPLARISLAEDVKRQVDEDYQPMLASSFLKKTSKVLVVSSDVEGNDEEKSSNCVIS